MSYFEAIGTVKFECSQKTLDKLILETKTWCDGNFLISGLNIPYKKLSFKAWTSDPFKDQILRLFDKVEPCGETLIKWDFYDFNDTDNKLYRFVGEIIYDPKKKPHTKVQSWSLTDLPVTAMTLSMTDLFFWTADLFTDYGLQKLKDYLIKYKPEDPTVKWILDQPNRDLIALFEDLKITKPDVKDYRAGDVTTVADLAIGAVQRYHGE